MANDISKSLVAKFSFNIKDLCDYPYNDVCH